jgi:hypothetical protein
MSEAKFGEWQPIATAPRDGTEVLLATDDRGGYGKNGATYGAWNGNLWETFHGDDEEGERVGPHWWMPLPEPPPEPAP